MELVLDVPYTRLKKRQTALSLPVMLCLRLDLGNGHQFVEDRRPTGHVGYAVIEERITRKLHQPDFARPRPAHPCVLFGSYPMLRTTRGGRTRPVVTIHLPTIRHL